MAARTHAKGSRRSRGISLAEARFALDSLGSVAVFHEIIYATDGTAADYRIVECNLAFSEATGIPRRSAVGRLASELYRRAPPFLDAYARVAATTVPEGFEVLFPPLDRRLRLSVSSRSPGRILVIGTEPREPDSRASELRRSQLLADHGLDAVLIVRKHDGRILDGNRAALFVYGWSRPELCVRSLQDLSARADLGMVAAHLGAADLAESRLEAHHVRKNGSTFPVEVRSTGADLDGERVIICVLRDISRRLAAPGASSSERAQLTAALQHVSDAVIGFDLDGRVTFLNKAAEQLTEWSLRDGVGRPALEFLGKPGTGATDAPGFLVQKVLSEGRTISVSDRSLLGARSGVQRVVCGMGVPIRDADGRISGAVLILRDQSAERSNARALEQSERRYRVLFENLGEEVTIYDVVRDSQGQVVDWVVKEQNGRARVALGPACPSLKGQRLSAILGPKVAGPFIERSREVLRTGLPTSDELYVDVTRRHYLASQIALDDDTLVTAALDITDHKSAEQALATSEKLYRTLFTLAPCGVLLHDMQGNIVAFNDRAALQLGYGRSEFGGLNVTDIDPEQTPAQLAQFLAEVHASGERQFTVRARTKAGEFRDILIALCPVAIDGEQRVLAVTQDQTEQLRATAALAESEERLRIAFQMSPDAICLNRFSDGAYVATSPGLARILGWQENEVLGRTPAELGIWRDHSESMRLGHLLRSQGVVSDFEIDLVARSGAVVPGLLAASVVQVKGEPHVLSIMRDVSRWRAAEADRAALRAKLHEAAKLEAVGRLASGVAHDFNNLLTVIFGCTQAALSELQAGRRADVTDLEEIITTGLRGRELTRQLLAVARRQVVSPAPTDLNHVVLGFERLLRRVLGEDVELQVSRQSELWPVLCDPGQIEQVLLNLAVNARDAMPGGGTLAIETSNSAAASTQNVPGGTEAGEVQLVVRDTGTGMSPAVRARIFEPFFTTKAEGTGSGLGLATVFGIVSQCRGSINVESQEGAGTCFTIRFPRTEGAATIPETLPSVPATRGHEAVLVVEDDPGVRDVIARALRAEGYTVVTACDHDEARGAALRMGSVDLLLTDVVLPGIDGRRLAANLRTAQPNLRVIFMSGHAERVLARGDHVEGGHSLLQKPFTPSYLLAQVRDVLDGPGAA